jgi:nitrogen fixation NifU-like protein
MKSVATMSGDELRDLYRELILDHARAPRHYGKLETTTHSAQGINPLCGDKLHLYLQCDGDDTIRQAAFEGSGCAISLASASLLTDSVIGLDRTAALALFEKLNANLAREDAEYDLGKLNALRGVREFPSRVKCATLAWQALRSALDASPTAATTEQ